jgi:serine/threonine-protein kinase
VEHVLEEQLPANHPRALAQNPAPVEVPDYPPGAIVHHLDAWMPEKIAIYKLRGFVNDAGGDVLESLPGLIRVRLGKRGSIYRAPGVNWFGLSKAGQINMELRMQQSESGRGNHLHITVVLTVVGHNPTQEPEWGARCEQVFIDLRAYLMGNTEVQ